MKKLNFIISLVLLSTIMAKAQTSSQEKIIRCINHIYNNPFLQNTYKTKKDYIASLGLGSGYYLLVDASNLTPLDICYIERDLKKLGYHPLYEKPINNIIVGIFDKKSNAKALQHLFGKQNAKILYIHTNTKLANFSDNAQANEVLKQLEKIKHLA
ncbi:MAG: hypothetical protein ACP5S8_07580, partial [Hydrogenobaculum sp.]